MSDICCSIKRAGPVMTLLMVIVGLVTLTSVNAWAGSYTVYVPRPNHVNDTANLQTALDTCVAHGPGCTVQLSAGNYLTRQLVAYNFRGTFKGKGKSKTVVEALPELVVTPGFPNGGECKPNTTDCLWPSLIIFVDGDIHISDMAIKITAVPSTKPWFLFDSEFTALIDAVRVMGQYRTNASVERVAISGMHDNSDTSESGFNVAFGVLFAGEFPRSETDLDYYFLSGAFSVTNSSFSTMFAGPGFDGFFKDSRLTIGGSPAAANFYEDLMVGIYLNNLENSIVEVSHNTVATGIFASAWVVPWCCWLPTKPSLYLIHDNTFKPTGPLADGVVLVDDPTNKSIYALINNNTVEAQDIFCCGGISAYLTNGTTIVNNKISGNGGDGIGIWDGTYAAVLGNDVTNFTASPDLAQIVLDGSLLGLSDTSHSTVVCKTSNDTVMNLGTHNKLIGCQEAGNNGNVSKMNSRPSNLGSIPMLKRKPRGR